MDDYIERKKILDFCNGVTNRDIDGDNDIVKAFKAFAEYVKAITSADVQPVVHGEWEKDHWCGEKARRCSVCHITQTVNVYKGKVMYQYCPYCGAKMDKRKGAGCTDCIKNGGDWECDHIHCHKGVG